jgi:hypothetical protein
VEGSTTCEVFDACVRRVLALAHSQEQVMDNLSSHRGSWVRELIEKCGCGPPTGPIFP